MANRYWVGGTATWSAANTAPWSATSGGSGGASVPTASDNVFFDRAGTYTVTFSGNLACNSFTKSAGTVTFFSSTSPTLSIYGSFTVATPSTWTTAISITFRSTSAGNVINIGGVTIGNGGHSFDGVGGSWTLASAFTMTTGLLTLANGSLYTAGYSVTAGAFLVSTTASSDVLDLGASTFTLSNTAFPWRAPASSLVNFNAGTSTINCTGAVSSVSQGFTGGKRTYYNVAFTNTARVNAVILDANTFNNLSFTGRTSAGVDTIIFDANQTIGTLTLSAGTNATMRTFFSSSALGVPRTLTVGTLTAGAADYDFRDITISGAVAPISGTRFGDCKGNSGITFDAAKTVYWNLAGNNSWSATAWATSGGGTVGVNNFPLAQDTAIFTATSPATGATTTVNANWNIGTIDMSARTTNTMTLAVGTTTPVVYGNWVNGTGTTISGSGTVTFSGRGSQTITSAGRTFTQPITIDSPGGTVTLSDALDLGTSGLTVTTGTFNTGGFALTAGSLSSSNTNTRTINLGASLVTLTGGTAGSVISFVTATNLTFNAGTSSIVFPNLSGLGTISLFNRTYYNVSFTSTAMTGLTITDANTFNDLNFVGTNATVGILSVLFGANQTVNGTFSVTGTTPIKRVFLYPITNNRQLSVTLTCNAVSSIDNCDFYEVIFAGNCISGGNITGTSVGDGGGNSGITFSAPKTVYWVGASGAAWYSANWATSSGGTGADANMPLPQDTMIVDDFAPASGGTVGPGSTARAVAGALNFSARTLPVTFAVTQSSFRNFWFGDMTLSSPVTLSVNTVSFYFTGATVKTLISAGKAFPSFNIESLASGGLILGDALTTTAGASITIGGGQINTNGYTLSAGQIATASASSSKAVYLGASTVTFSEIGINLTTGTTRTIDGGTSNITLNNSQGAIVGTSGYVNNVTSTSGDGYLIVGGITSANNITFAAKTGNGVNTGFFRLGNDFTINGTLTIPPSSATTRRRFIQSDRFDTVRNLSINSVSAGLNNLDFSNIAVTGAAASLSGTNFGDCGGNSGVTFPAAKTVYWNLAAGGNWDATAWATSVGGIPDVNNFPLAQDTAVFAATGLNSGATVTNNVVYNICTVDMSLRTSNTIIFSFTTSANIMGNWINGTGTTIIGTSTIFFSKNGTQTITSAGKTFTFNLRVEKAGTLVLQDAFTSNSASGTALTAGTLDLNGYVFTSSSFSASSALPSTIAMNSGTLVLTSSSTAFGGGANTTFTGAGIISLTSASAKNFSGAGIQSFPTLNQGGTGALTVSGSNKFADMTNTAIGSVLFTGGTSNEFTDFNLNGVAGNLLTLGSTNTTQAILKKSTPWNVGANSVDAGNNTGLNFI